MAEFNRQPSPNGGKKKINRACSVPFGRAKKGKKNKNKADVVHIVEKVLDKRYVDGRCELLLKWQGYSEKQSSWEPIENLTDECLVLVSNFERQRAKDCAKATTPTKKQSIANQEIDLEVGEIDLSSASSCSGESSVSSVSDGSDHEAGDQEVPTRTLKQSELNRKRAHSDRSEQANRMPSVKTSIDTIKAQARQWQDKKIANKTFPSNKPEQQTNNLSSRRRKTMYADCNEADMEHVSISENRRLSQDKGPTRNTERFDSVSKNQTRAKDNQQKNLQETLLDPNTSSGSNGNVASNGIDSHRWDYDLRVPDKPQGIERGLTLERIVKAFNLRGEVFMVTKWKNCGTLDIVPASRLTELYPHVMIQYYEKLELRA
ncbi:hypothetical protein ACLKA6_014828 [Drosophila palustris]